MYKSYLFETLNYLTQLKKKVSKPYTTRDGCTNYHSYCNATYH